MTDQYDAILRALKPETLVTINNQPNVGEPPSGELEVKSTREDKTEVYLKETGGKWHRIRRDTDDELVYYREDEHKSAYQGKIITLEIVGIV